VTVAAKPRAPFVVAIVVDQLSAWVAASRWPELPKDGGFARLAREGTWVKNMRYPYAVTDTAPGHAALATGKVPAESGIVGNEIPDGEGGRIPILHDDTTRVVTPGGIGEAASSSAARLRAPTVADRLRAAHPDALIVSVSLKDRAAILPAGAHPTHALWFEPSQDAFVTSTAFESTFPQWASPLANHRAVERARSVPWEPTDRAWLAAHSAGPDDQLGEGDLDGLGTTFPHVARTAAAFRALPASDEMILELGLEAIRAEYDPSKPTLLLLSFSASDVIGHVFGPDSWEAWDQLRKLDAKLAVLLDTLERRAGDFSVLLAADHGNLPMPEIASKKGKAGVRLEPHELEVELAESARAVLGLGRWIAGISDPYVFLTPRARALGSEERASLDHAIHTTFRNHAAGISEVIDARTLAERCPDVIASAKGIPMRAKVGEDVLSLVCRAWAPIEGAGDYYVVPTPGSFFDSEIVVGKGGSHGSPYLYDRTVPMLVRAPGAIDAGAVVDAPVDFTAYAALEASLLGLDARTPRAVLDAATAK
jgi:hypothetical protein